MKDAERIERLQNQLGIKDARIRELEQEAGRVRGLVLALRNVRGLAAWMLSENIQPDMAKDLLKYCASAGVVSRILRSSERPVEPPFDGKPCPMCPAEIRNLAAVAHNFVVQMEGGHERRAKALRDTFWRLKEAVESTRPFSDAHFANREHSHGTKG